MYKTNIFLLVIILSIIRLNGQSNFYSDSLEMIIPIGHLAPINSAKIKGDFLYTGSMDKSIILWDLKSKKQLRTLFPSSDIVFDFDLAKNSDLILVTHQNNYISIISSANKSYSKKLFLGEYEICERAFFCNSDNFLVAIVFDLHLNKKLVIYETENYHKVEEFGISSSSEVQKSADGNYVICLASDSLLNVVKFHDLRFDIVQRKLNYSLQTFGLDNSNNSVLLVGNNLVERIGVDQFNLIEKIEYEPLSNRNNIESILPIYDNNLILVSNSQIYKLRNSNLELEFLDSFQGNRLRLASNTYDSTVFVASDSLYLFDVSGKKKSSAVFPIDGLREIPLLNISDNFILVLGLENIKLYDKRNLNRPSLKFSGLVVGKYKIELSENGERIGVVNSLGEIELFSPNKIFDFAVVRNKVWGSNYYKVLNQGGVIGLNNSKQIVHYDPSKSSFSTFLSAQDEIYNWRYFENSKVLKIINSSNKLEQYNENSQLINSSNIQNISTEALNVNDSLDFGFIVHSDNYSYCNFEFGSLISTEKQLNKKNCSNGISEGLFRIGFTSNSTISFIDENDWLLNTVDVRNGGVLGRINLGDIDEISDVQYDRNDSILFVASVDNSINLYNLLKEQRIQSLNIHKGYVTDLKYHNKNGFLYSVGRDGQLSVYHLPSRRHIYSMFSFGGNAWLVKLPNSPYYMCSKAVSKKLHYVTPSMKVIGFDQLDPIFNRPDIVLDTIANYFGGVDRQLVQMYRKAWIKRFGYLGLDENQLAKSEISVPEAEIVGSGDIEYENNNGELLIKIKANDPKYLLRRFNVLVNEVPIYGSNGISIAHLKKQQWDTTISLPLSLGENKIQVSVMNELGLENFKYPTYVNYTANNDAHIVTKTHYIGIGVNEFNQQGHQLNYCVEDISDLADEFDGKSTVTKLFVNQNVTRENILELKQYLIDSTTVNDKVIISCSSHGLLDDSLNFYLATHDVDFNNPNLGGLKYEELEGLLDGIPARKKLLLLDACNSGENDKTEMIKFELAKNIQNMNATEIAGVKGIIIKMQEEYISDFKKMNELFVNVQNNTGSIIISAAGGQESALEAIEVNGEKIENGAFTYCVLEYLKANQSKPDELTVNKLKHYVESRVEQITNGKQNPTSRQELMEVDWNLR